jgi:hypothetical protein
MNPPARTIRREVKDACVGGIRQRGPEAVGIVIIGMAYVFLAVVVFAVLTIASLALHVDLNTGSMSVMGFASAWASWLIRRLTKWPTVTEDPLDGSSGSGS